jgi:hypothetical protein
MRVALLGLLLVAACAKRVETAKDLKDVIAEGHTLTAPRNITGSAVQVQFSFKDGSPPCVMLGEVTLARDPVHRWVWLEPTAGCPEWTAGRWFAELVTDAAGWHVSNISTEPIHQ